MRIIQKILKPLDKLYKGLTSMNQNSTVYIKQRWEKDISIVSAEEGWHQAWLTQCSPQTPSFGEISVGKIWSVFYNNLPKIPVLLLEGVWMSLSGQCSYLLVMSTYSAFLERSGTFNIRDSGPQTRFFPYFPLPGQNPQWSLWKWQIPPEDLYGCKQESDNKVLASPPTTALLIDIINSIRSMEKMTFSLRLQKEKGDKYWKKWDCCNQIHSQQ